MTDLALSTMWGVKRFDTLAEFFKQGSALGFAQFELNHAINSAMLNNVNGYRVVSVHEPCPADISVGELKKRNWLISAPNERDRREGVNAIKRSIDLAQKLGARAVIVHPGKIDLDTAIDNQIRDWYRQGKRDTPEYARLRDQFVAARAAQARVNFSAARHSVIELAEYAGERDIKLGLENRYHYFEIPSPDELCDLLELGFDNVGFWYDVGHAETWDQLGFVQHEEWLRRFSARMIGVHLHDIVGIDDHHAAGTGQVNWEMVARYLPADAMRTCEFQNDNSPEQVAAGVKWLIEKGCVPA
ncbi:MAG: sugar phosphate isomerase/epimerase [Anaerolineales bacterium]|nr:sugar phosphate isomerase/epimerase [Anaerolineales bacterium]